MMKSPDYGYDIRLLFATRMTRMFAYGLLSVVLALYLATLGLTGEEIGFLLTCTLLGDVVVSLFITTVADRIGRKRMLMLGGVLMAAAGAAFALTSNYALLIIAATIGVIAPSDKDVGPFLSIEQAALAQLVHDAQRTHMFAWYNLAGSFATAAGALLCGVVLGTLQSGDTPQVNPYRTIIAMYTVCGLALIALFGFLSRSSEVQSAAHIGTEHRFALHHSRGVVMKLSGLFALDAFAGGFIVQSMMAYWFHLKFGVAPETLGGIFFGANVLAGCSALLAARLAKKFGLINTMVYTHIPSSVLLILVPLMPTLELAIAALLLRFTISQMDVPTRQSYTMAVVRPEERSAASGITNVARSVGGSIAPTFTGQMLSVPGLWSLPFFLAGGLKILYDLMLYRSFRRLRPPEEKPS